MKRQVLLISAVLCFLFLSPYSYSQSIESRSCKLDSSDTLVIGCTYGCGRFNRWALRKYARKLGYKIKLLNIYSDKASPNLDLVDGILIPGGADINPAYYTPFVEEELREHVRSLDYLVEYTQEGQNRDPFEYQLLQKYFNSKKPSVNHTPILGICRGMQMLTVSQKIPLYVDIKEELGFKNRRYTLDRIYVTKKESLIANLMGRTKFRGVELHHQGLRLNYFNANRERWPHLDVTAVSNGGTIAEVLEFYDRPVMGVQFHPEYTFGRARRSIFSWLLKRACHKKNLDKQNL